MWGAVRPHDIPDEMILNWDQTGVNIVPVGSWTLKEEGSKQVPITGLEDKPSGNSSGSTPTNPAGIFGVFKAHRDPDLLEKLREANIRAVFVPASCTGKLQPLDAVGGINDLLKRDLQQSFISHYADCFAKERKTGHDIKDVKVDLKLSMLKPPPPPCQLAAWGLQQNKHQHH
ncbi:Hypp4042 [Branchiostoma lanceolatum]|uniref:Hypp4042 protein n=1 Tax=Branchiostoma lanceolatum TaxID=7740 RepID=A0A8K0A5F5_BRALA|nr:Hypp4042 [Branchiostoma lanceolatum]